MSKQTMIGRVVRMARMAALVVAVLLGAMAQPAAAQTQTRGVALTVRNATSVQVFTLHMRVSGQGDWSNDLLGEQTTIPARGSWRISVPPGTYDILALDRNGATVGEVYGARVTRATTWTIPQPTSFTLVNASGAEICFLNLSPVSSDEWGPDVLGEETTIPAGGRWTVTVVAGRYDVRGLDCNEEVVFEEYNLDLRRSLRLTVE